MTDPAPGATPGIFYDVPMEVYRAWPYPSQSQLRYWRDEELCELEIKHLLEAPDSQTEAMRLGCFYERAVDGLEISPDVQLLPPEIKARRGAAWEELRDNNPGVTFLPPSEYSTLKEQIEIAQSMAQATHAHPLAEKLLAGAKRQVSFVWDATFVGQSGEMVTHRVKGRLDYWQDKPIGKMPKVIVDLKSTSAGGQRSIGRTAWQNGYDIQAALYTDAMRDLLKDPEIGFYFIFCRTKAPYVVSVYNGQNTAEMADQLLMMGRGHYQIALEKLGECRRTGNWRGYVDLAAPDSMVLDMMLPNWAS